MEDLTLVGVHDDGEHLVLSGVDGRRFRVRVDEPMRAAVRRDRARLGQLQLQNEATLRPRDIQARIRGGASAQEVAEASGLPVEHVRRYEGPVLAEREFVARQARAVRVRRPDGSDPTLDDVVGDRLDARGVDGAGIGWDAWRQDDGQWSVVLTFTAGSRARAARWIYDCGLRHVVPQDDEARWLTDEDAPEPGVPAPRRLAPVRDPLQPAGRVHDRVYDVEADGAVHPSAVDDEGARATVDLLDTLRRERGRRPRPGSRSLAAHSAAGLDATELDVTDLDAADPVDLGEQVSGGRVGEPDILDLDAAERAGRRTAAGRRPAVDPPEPGPVAGQQPLPLDGARGVAAGEIPAAHPPRSRPDLADDAEILLLADDDASPDDAPGADHEAAAGAPSAAGAAGGQGAASARDGRAAAFAGGPTSAGGPTPATAAVRHQTGRSGRPASRGQTPAGQQGRPDGSAKRTRRASVPSWDDIVFGSRRE